MIGLLRRGLMLGGVMLLVLTARLGGVKGGDDECRAVALLRDTPNGGYAVFNAPDDYYALRDAAAVSQAYWQGRTPDGAGLVFSDYANPAIRRVSLMGRATTLTTGSRSSALFLTFVAWLPNGEDVVYLEHVGTTAALYATCDGGRQSVALEGQASRQTYAVNSSNQRGQFMVQGRNADTNTVRWYLLDTARTEPILLRIDDDREQRLGLWWAADGASLVTLWEVEGQREIERFVFADGSRQSLFVPYEWTVQFIDYTGEAVFLRNLNNPATLYRVTWDGAPPQPFMERGDGGPYVVGWCDERTVLLAPVTPFTTNMVPVPLQWVNTVTGAVEPLPFEAAYFGPWDAEYQRLYVGLLNETGQQATMAAWRDDLQQLTTLSTYRRDGLIHPSPCGDTYMLVDGLGGGRRTQWGYTFRTGVTSLAQGMDMWVWLTLPAYEWHAGRLVVGGVLMLGVGGLLGVVRRRVRGVGW